MSAERKKVINVDFNVDDWELAGWPEDLWKTVEVEKTEYGLTIEVSSELMEKAARKIAREAIETYVQDATWWFSDKGLEVADINYVTQFVVPWDNLILRDETDLDRLQAMIDERRKEIKDDEQE